MADTDRDRPRRCPVHVTFVAVFVALVVLAFLQARRSGAIRVRDVLEELEAPLVPARPDGPAAAASGKAERKRYADGGEKLKVRCSGLALPDGAPVALLLGERMLAEEPVEDGRVRFEWDSAAGAAVPPVAEGEALALVHTGEVLVIGTFAPD